MKTLTTLILALVVTGVMGQSKKPQFTDMPDCGSFFTTIGNPCKTPVIINGKLSYYTVSKPEIPKVVAYLTSSTTFQTMQPSSFYWFIFGLKMDMLTANKPVGAISDGVDSIRLHINKSQLHWLNDSTAIITKPKSK